MSVTEMQPVRLVDHVSGYGPAMLLVHGGSGSHRHWDRVREPLSRNFRVHAPDLPGYGESPDAPGDPDGDAYIEVAAASLSALLATDSAVDLVGFSFGGAVAAGVARVLGTRVRRLTLIGPGGFGKPVGREIARRSRGETDSSAAHLREVARHNLGTMMFADAEAIDEATLDLQMWNLARSRFDSLRVSYQDRVLDDVAHVGCPVQFIWGANDVLAYPSPAARAERVRIVRPDAELHIVPGGGHWTQYECPDAVVRLLNHFHAPAAARTENT